MKAAVIMICNLLYGQAVQMQILLLQQFAFALQVEAMEIEWCLGHFWLNV